MTRKYIRIHVEALEACTNPAQIAATVALYRLADARRWDAFPASDRFLQQALGTPKSTARRLIGRLQEMRLLEVVAPGDRETPRQIRLAEPGKKWTTYRTTYRTTKRTTPESRERAIQADDPGGSKNNGPPSGPPTGPPSGPNYHISLSRNTQTENQRERDQRQEDPLEQSQTDQNSLSLSDGFSEILIRTYSAEPGAERVTGDQQAAARLYALEHPETAERLSREPALLQRILRAHLDSAAPTKRNLGALLRFEEIIPSLLAEVDSATDNQSRWSRHARQARIIS